MRVEQVVHIAYNDSRKLTQELAKIFGANNFEVEVRATETF